MDDPGPSKEESDTAVEEVLNSVVSEVAHGDCAIVPLDSPSFSSSSFSVETAASSEIATDHEEIAPPVKKRKGRPPKNKQQVVPSAPKTARKRVPVAQKRKNSDNDKEKSPSKKKGRPAKPAALKLTSPRNSGGGCLSQKVCRRPRRKSDSPDPFADDDEEFDRVTRKMTAPKKRSIEFFHQGTILASTTLPRIIEKELRVVPFALIEKIHKDIPEFGEVMDYPNDSIVFTDD